MSRILAWNVNQNRGDVWPTHDRLNPDVSLLTEVASLPDRYRGVWAGHTHGLDAKTRPFAAAVVTPDPFTLIGETTPRWRTTARRVPLRASKPGAWAVARVVVPGVGPITSISLYGLMDEMSDASMHRSLSDVAGLIDDPEHRGHLVIGGDFNTGTQWPKRDRRWQAADANVLDRLAAWQLVDLVDVHREGGRLPGCLCTLGDDCRHVRTRRDPRWPDRPYQTDYLYASPELAERVTDCRVLADDDHFARSDHTPIIADIADR